MSILQISNPYVDQPQKAEEWNRDWEKLGELQITCEQIADRMQSLFERVTQMDWQSIDGVSVWDCGMRAMLPSKCPFGCKVDRDMPGRISFKNLDSKEEFHISTEQIHMIRQHADLHLKELINVQGHLDLELVVRVLGIRSGVSYATKTERVTEKFWKWVGAKMERVSVLETDRYDSLVCRYGLQEVALARQTALDGRMQFLLDNRTVLHIVTLPNRKEPEQLSSIPIEFDKMEEATVQFFHLAERNVMIKTFSDGTERRTVEGEFADLSEQTQKKRKLG